MTIQQAKDQAAREIYGEDFRTAVIDIIGDDFNVLSELINRAMEIYAETKERRNREEPVKEGMDKLDLIKSIYVNKANFEHIASTGKINGTLLSEISRAMEIYAEAKEREAFEMNITKERLIEELNDKRFITIFSIPEDIYHFSLKETSEYLLNKYYITPKNQKP